MEGIVRHNSVGPHEILVDDEGQFRGVVFKRCLRVYDDERRFSPIFDETERSTLEGDTLLLSVGQQIRFEFIDEVNDGVRLTERGFVDADPETGQARSASDVFVAGDCAYGPKLAIHAIASGKKAARGVYAFLTGEHVFSREVQIHVPLAGYEREKDYEKIPRLQLPVLPASERRMSLSKPVELPLLEEDARREASRCLDCGVNTIFDGDACILCGGCVDVCPFSCLRLVSFGRLAGTPDLGRLAELCLPETAGDGMSAILKDEDRCIRCSLCAQRCPTGAITMERFQFEEVWDAAEAHPA
jgi:ferredoxin